VEEARKWDGKPLILYGASGTGKTLLAKLIAAEKGWDVVEVSDENIGEAESIANTGSLFGTKKMVLIEDVDSIRDIKAVGELVEKTGSPVLMTTSDYGNKRLSTLKKKCGRIQLRRPLPASIVKYLEGVCGEEGVNVDKAVLERIAKNAGGDIRAALCDLELLAKGRVKVSEGDVGELLPERDREVDIYRALSVIFGGRDFNKVVESTWNLDEQLRDVLWWVDENTPRLYQDKTAIGEAYGNLARADVFLGRIMRRQYWGFLRYANVLMTAGVNTSRPSKINFTQYMFPGYFAALGRSKGVRATEEGIAGKMSPMLHASARIIKREYIPLYKLLLKKKKMSAEEVRQQFNLDESEVEYLSS
jgi:replication factor C large subunit